MTLFQTEQQLEFFANTVPDPVTFGTKSESQEEIEAAALTIWTSQSHRLNINTVSIAAPLETVQTHPYR